jgi:hypothetical protein
MIPTQNIVAWSKVAPWAEPRQVEQDLTGGTNSLNGFWEGVRLPPCRRGGTGQGSSGNSSSARHNNPRWSPSQWLRRSTNVARPSHCRGREGKFRTAEKGPSHVDCEDLVDDRPQATLP